MADFRLKKTRRIFRWSAKARELANANLKATGIQLRQIVTQLVEMTGNPRSACRRFIYRMGNKTRLRYKEWPDSERQRLLKLLDENSVADTARLMRCSESAIYGMLRRLKLPTRMRRDCITKTQLAALLHVHRGQVKSWIGSGKLKATVIQVGSVTRTVIKPEDFLRFCEEHVETVIGNRLNLERLEFIYKYVFPPDHNCLLSVRKHKKERATSANESTPLELQQEPEAGSDIQTATTQGSAGG